MSRITNHSLDKTRHLPMPKLLTSDCPATLALRQGSYAGLAKVTCEVSEGMAILHGKVSTFYLKQLAQELVKKVEGVEAVVNRVDVGYR
ncbi:MAG: BON domain-containing protein [Planctomycetota bacterium]